MSSPLQPEPGGRIEVVTKEYRFRLRRTASANASDEEEAVSVAAELARVEIGREVVECALAVFTDADHHIIGFTHVARGTLNRAGMPACDVVRPALLVDAHGLVLAHNHPSGALRASPADIAHLDGAGLAADLFGLRVLAGVVVTADAWQRIPSVPDVPQPDTPPSQRGSIAMAKSTAVADHVTAPTRMPGRLDPCPRAALRHVIDAAAEDVSAAVFGLPPGVPSKRPTARTIAVLMEIAEETGRLAVSTGRKGRIVRRSELARFVELGTACCEAGTPAEDMIATLDAAGEAVLDTLVFRALQCDEQWTREQIDQTIVALCGCVETLTRFAHDELVNGYFGERRVQLARWSPSGFTPPDAALAATA